MKILLLGPLWRNEPIKQFLLSKGNEVVTTEGTIDLDFTRSNRIELIISSGYAPIIKEPVVKEYPHKIINLHATYLPYGKGIGTTFFSVFEGTPTGISIHFIDSGIDTGDVLFRKAVCYSKYDTLRSMHRKLLVELEQLFYEKWDDIALERYDVNPQETYTVKVPYRSRVDSERFMDLLPQRWDTPLTQIEELGADFLMGEEFWDRYERDMALL